MAYDLQSVRTPRLTGFGLRAAAALVDNSFTRPLLAPTLLKGAGIDRFRALALTEAPSIAPRLPRPGTPEVSPATPAGEESQPPARRGFEFETVADFARAFREKRTTPNDVAETLIAALKAADAATPPLRAIVAFDEAEIRRQAKASTERHKAGQSLGPFDGVPVAIKDELNLVPYPTTVGTKFLHNAATVDSTVAARLRAAGAVLYGKANMHEIGIDTSGFNAHHGTPRNPYDLGRYTGGSSSGCGSAVGAGLGPVAIGADGGGSIRIPASLCGVVGLKATWSRISEAGAAPLCWSVGHCGPLGATVRDVAIAYSVIAGADARDANTMLQPAMQHPAYRDGRLDGVRLGIYRPWFDHAAPDVVKACSAAVEKLRGLGAMVVDIEVPDLEMARLAHAITILSEMATGVDPYDREHRRDYSHGVRLNLALARELTNRDFVRAQQVRTRMSNHFDGIFSRVDAIVTPTTGITAPKIRPDVFPSGESDLDMTSAMMRFVFPANLTGHPALSVPCGVDGDGMPVGLQLMGRPWEEHLLLRIGESVERLVERPAPKIHHRLLA